MPPCLPCPSIRATVDREPAPRRGGAWRRCIGWWWAGAAVLSLPTLAAQPQTPREPKPAPVTSELAPAPLPPSWSSRDDGASVVDERARLVWSRCVEGMSWNGRTCTGQPLWFDFQQAVTAASVRAKADGHRWRLPQVKELQRLVGPNGGGMDPVLFPAAPVEWHWSGTAQIRSGSVNPYNYGNVMQGATGGQADQLSYLHGWAVHLGTGQARGDVTKRSTLPVRLVHPMD